MAGWTDNELANNQAAISAWGAEPYESQQTVPQVPLTDAQMGTWDDGSSGGGILGSGISGSDIAKALNTLQSGLKGDDKSGSESGAGRQSAAPVGQAQSGTGQGSPGGINALIQMLMQRANAYFPGQPNRQPVALARPSGGGLLGI